MDENGLESDSYKFSSSLVGGAVNIYFPKTVFLKYCLWLRDWTCENHNRSDLHGENVLLLFFLTYFRPSMPAFSIRPTDKKVII